MTWTFSLIDFLGRIWYVIEMCHVLFEKLLGMEPKPSEERVSAVIINKLPSKKKWL